MQLWLYFGFHLFWYANLWITCYSNLKLNRIRRLKKVDTNNGTLSSARYILHRWWKHLFWSTILMLTSHVSSVLKLVNFKETVAPAISGPFSLPNPYKDLAQHFFLVLTVLTTLCDLHLSLRSALYCALIWCCNLRHHRLLSSKLIQTFLLRVVF